VSYAGSGTGTFHGPIAYCAKSKIWESVGSGIADMLGIPIFLVNAGIGSATVAINGSNLGPAYMSSDVTSNTVGPQTENAMDGNNIPEHKRHLLIRDKRHVGFNAFGSSPQFWQSRDIGSVHIVRANDRPCPPEHVKALAAYVKDIVQPRFAGVIAGFAAGDSVPTREGVLGSMTRADFLDHYIKNRVAFVAAPQVLQHFWEGQLPPPHGVHRNLSRKTAIWVSGAH
jgi:hypothetical protein